MYKVIIIDDEILIREGLKSIVDWDKYGFEVVGEAEDGISGADIVRMQQPDLILVDIRMPGLTGLELIKRVRNEGYQGEVIILTGYSEFVYAQEAIRYSVTSYLLKPIEEDVLCENLEVIKSRLDQLQAGEVFSNELKGVMRRSLCRKLLFDDHLSQHDQSEIDDDSFLTKEDQYHVVTLKRQKGYVTEMESLLIKLQTAQLPPVKIDLENSYILVYRNKTYRQLSAILSAFCNEYHQLTDELCFVTVGGIVKGYLSLRKSFLEGKGLSERQFLYRNQNVIFWDAYVEDTEVERNLYMDIDYVYGLVEVGNQEAVEVYFNKLEEDLIRSSLSVEKIRSICMNGFIGVTEKLSIHYNQVQPLLPKNPIIMDKIYDYSNLSEIILYIKGILSELSEVICDGSYENTMMRLLNYIHNNFQKNLKLEALARLFSYNSSYLGKIFKERVGKNFNAYLDDLRIEYAKELLQSESYKIYEIADKVGYSNVDYFYSKFKKQVGQSPKAYRKALNDGEISE